MAEHLTDDRNPIPLDAATLANAWRRSWMRTSVSPAGKGISRAAAALRNSATVGSPTRMNAPGK
jgi:hypothetical protein